MYDPLIVDTFVRVHSELVSQITTTSSLPRQALNEIAGSTQVGPRPITVHPRLDDIAASANEMLTLYELASALAGQASISDTGDVISKHIRRLIPFTQSILFLYESETDELVAKHAMGDMSSVVRGLRIPLGERLSGWVAANRKTIVNSDPVLDLGDVVRTRNPRLRSCLSAPLTSHDHLVGVLTLYSEAVDGFNEDHKRVIEVVARQIGHTFKCAADFDSSPRRDALTGLPKLEQLEQLVATIGNDSSLNESVTLLFIDVVHLKQINQQYGRSVGDEVLRHVALHAGACLTMTDILFRHGSDEFVALLNDSDVTLAQKLSERICENVRLNPLPLRSARALTIDIDITPVMAPRDGASLQDLIAAGRVRVAGRLAIGPDSIIH